MSLAIKVPSTRNSTCVTPAVAFAFADSGTVLLTEPAAGAVSDTVGGGGGGGV